MRGVFPISLLPLSGRFPVAPRESCSRIAPSLPSAHHGDLGRQRRPEWGLPALRPWGEFVLLLPERSDRRAVLGRGGALVACEVGLAYTHDNTGGPYRRRRGV